MACERKGVSFRNGAIDISADLRFPDGFDENSKYLALVIVTPGSSVKEQIGGNYAEKLAERGYITLVFDPSCQGRAAASLAMRRIRPRGSRTSAAPSTI